MDDGTTFFIPFPITINPIDLPQRFVLMKDEVHPLCAIAARDLQDYIANQQDWEHNFGLAADKDNIIGKMFGVLVVENSMNEIGYLAAFSGKLAGSNHHTKFVPPIFDTLAADGFLNEGMLKLGKLSDEIRLQEDLNLNLEKVKQLKTERKKFSNALQNEIFENYHFLNQAGAEKSLKEIFEKATYKNPPAGAGECAAPKLLQYAFQHQLKPIAMAEFWWGLSPKSTTWKHKEFYACCKEKCEPILQHALSETNYVFN